MGYVERAVKRLPQKAFRRVDVLPSMMGNRRIAISLKIIP